MEAMPSTDFKQDESAMRWRARAAGGRAGRGSMTTNLPTATVTVLAQPTDATPSIPPLRPSTMAKLPALFCLVGGTTTVAAASSPFFITTIRSPLPGAGDTFDPRPGGATTPFGAGYVPTCLDPSSFAGADYPGAWAPAWALSGGWAAYSDCIRDTLVVNNASQNSDPPTNFTSYRAATTAVEDGHVPPLEMVDDTYPAIIFGATTAPCHSIQLRQTPINAPERNLSLAFHAGGDLPPVHLPVYYHAHELMKPIPNRGKVLGPVVVVALVKHMYSSIIKKGAANIDDDAAALFATKSTVAGAITGTSHQQALPLVMAALLLAASSGSGRRCWRTTMLVPILMMVLCTAVMADEDEDHEEDFHPTGHVAYDVATCEDWAKGDIYTDVRSDHHTPKCTEDGQKCATSIEQCLKDECNQLCLWDQNLKSVPAKIAQLKEHLEVLLLEGNKVQCFDYTKCAVAFDGNTEDQQPCYCRYVPGGDPKCTPDQDEVGIFAECVDGADEEAGAHCLEHHEYEGVERSECFQNADRKPRTNNQLTSLPAEMAELTKLTSLQLAGNRFTQLPAVIFKLTALESLGFYGNQVTSLPSEIGNLSYLRDISLEYNQLTSLPPEIKHVYAFTGGHMCYLSSNQLRSLPAEIDHFRNRIETLYAASNNLATLPPEIGNFTNLVELWLPYNNLTSLPSELGKLKRLTDLQVDHNPGLASYPRWPALYFCSFGFFEKNGLCINCKGPEGPTDADFALTYLTLAVALILGGLVTWRVAGADWRPDIQSGDSCVVHFGRVDAGHGAAEAWFSKVEERLQEDAGSVRLDHAAAEIVRGDEIIIRDSADKKKLRGLHGIVTQVDGNNARVALHGKGRIKVAMKHLELVPAAGLEPNLEHPALCFCVSEEWCRAATFSQDITGILGVRSGIVLKASAIRDMAHHHKRHLTAGCTFVLCGEAVLNTDGHLFLVEALQVKEESMLVGDARTGEPKSIDDTNRLLGIMEDFLQNQREQTTEHEANSAAKEELIVESVLFNSDAKSSIASAQQAAKQLANVVKIVGAQLQQCLLALSVSLEWPKIVTDFASYFRGLMFLNIGDLVPLACTVEDVRGDADTAAQYMQGVVTLVLPILMLRSYHQWRWSRGDVHAGETAAHLTNFMWALYTLVGVSVVTQALKAALDYRNPNTEDDVKEIILQVIFGLHPGLILVFLVLGIPAYGLRKLAQAHKKSLLRSRAFEARMGWLCARYKESCYWWEFLYVVVRFATMIVVAISGRSKHPDFVCAVFAPSLSECGEHIDCEVENSMGMACCQDRVTRVDQFVPCRLKMRSPADLADAAAAAAVVVLVITIMMTALQLKLKPFEETAKEAQGGWRTSPNRQAEISYACQLVVMVCGLLPKTFPKEALSVVILVALFLPLVMTVYLLSVTAVQIVDVLDSSSDDDDDDDDGQYANPLNDQLPDPEVGAIEAPAAVELNSEQDESATGNDGGGEGVGDPEPSPTEVLAPSEALLEVAATAGVSVEDLHEYNHADLSELLKDELKLGVIERNKIMKELTEMQSS